MKICFNIRESWEENIGLTIIILAFIEMHNESIHDIIKYPMAVLGVLLLICCYLYHKPKNTIAFVIFLTIVLDVYSISFNGWILSAQYIYDLVVCIPVALAMNFAKNVNQKKWILLYIIASIDLIYLLLNSPNYYSIFYSHSRNYISVFLLFFMFMTAVVSQKNNRNLPEWMYYTTVIICVISVGRGGILSSFVLLGLFLSRKFLGEKNSKKIKLLLIIFIVFIFIFFYQEYILKTFFSRFIGSGGEESSTIAVTKRLLMWNGYIAQCVDSLYCFFLGSDPYPIVMEYHHVVDFNLHNSYFMVHVFYGLLGLGGFLFFSLRFTVNLIKEKSELSIIFISFLVRAFTDHVFPGKLCSIVIWFAVFYVLLGKKHSL